MGLPEKIELVLTALKTDLWINFTMNLLGFRWNYEQTYYKLHSEISLFKLKPISQANSLEETDTPLLRLPLGLMELYIDRPNLVVLSSIRCSLST